MKANEAPKKIILSADKETGKLYDEWVIRDLTDNIKIEYIRTDAFIEKAAAWLEEHKEAVETEDNGIMGWIPDYFIENFKNYMKGE